MNLFEVVKASINTQEAAPVSYTHLGLPAMLAAAISNT